ncbi:MAG: hypothetical protein Q9223_007498, partial [Gallowayella weberi]
MPTTTSQLPKDQPWKAHWSSENKAAKAEDQKYLVNESGTLLVDGAGSAGPISELACARKEPEAAKAQPWKSHWSAGNNVPLEDQKYLVNESGTLLVDGAGSAGLVSELAACCKED